MGLLEIGRGPTEIFKPTRVLEMPIVIWIHVTRNTASDWLQGLANWHFFTHFLMDLSASGIYFGSPFSRYPTFHTLTSVGRKKCFQYVKRMFPLFLCNSEILQYQRIFHKLLNITKRNYIFFCED